jgi:hypothetical protein
VDDELIVIEDERDSEKEVLIPIRPPDATVPFRKAIALTCSGELLALTSYFMGMGWTCGWVISGLLSLTMLILGVRRWKSERRPAHHSIAPNTMLTINKNLSLLLSGMFLACSVLFFSHGMLVASIATVAGSLALFVCGLRRWKSERFRRLPADPELIP